MIRKILLIASLALLITSCASVRENRTYCIVAGTVAGALIAGVAEDDSQSDAALGGAAIGATAAWFFCRQDADGDGVNDDKDRCPGTPKGTSVDSSGCPLDSDGDGVTDSIDQCPNTEPGVKVDAMGCDLDSDGDGVRDSSDQCPNTPAGRKVDSRGCELDGDGDGVADAVDECPATKPGKAVDSKGCNVMFTLRGVNFEFNSDKLTDVAKSKLEEVIEELNDQRRISVRIEGHTDYKGSQRYNQGLSERRAASVKSYLEMKGISAARMTTRGMGELSPVATNETDAGRALNRRVEFVVTAN